MGSQNQSSYFLLVWGIGLGQEIFVLAVIMFKEEKSCLEFRRVSP
jgi:hypothetical protein